MHHNYGQSAKYKTCQMLKLRHLPDVLPAKFSHYIVYTKGHCTMLVWQEVAISWPLMTINISKHLHKQTLSTCASDPIHCTNIHSSLLTVCAHVTRWTHNTSNELQRCVVSSGRVKVGQVEKNTITNCSSEPQADSKGYAWWESIKYLHKTVPTESGLIGDHCWTVGDSLTAEWRREVKRLEVHRELTEAGNHTRTTLSNCEEENKLDTVLSCYLHAHLCTCTTCFGPKLKSKGTTGYTGGEEHRRLAMQSATHCFSWLEYPTRSHSSRQASEE